MLPATASFGARLASIPQADAPSASTTSGNRELSFVPSEPPAPSGRAGKGKGGMGRDRAGVGRNGQGERGGADAEEKRGMMHGMLGPGKGGGKGKGGKGRGGGKGKGRGRGRR